MQGLLCEEGVKKMLETTGLIEDRKRIQREEYKNLQKRKEHVDEIKENLREVRIENFD